MMQFVPSPLHIIRTRLPLVSALLDRMSSEGVTIHVVGGSVRDWLLGRGSFDFDIEIMGLTTIDQLKSRLKSLGQLNEVGRDFLVVRYENDGYSVDFTLARQDIKVGVGHRGFRVDGEGVSDFSVAAARRDFTINAIGIEWVFGAIVDPFNGRSDLSAKILRHVSDQFDEDPLRVLRALQFAGRFEFSIHPDTLARCRRLSIAELPPARVRQSLEKLFQQAASPSFGLRWIPTLGLDYAWPEMRDWIQSPEWALALARVDAGARRVPRVDGWMLVGIWLVSWGLMPETSAETLNRWLARWCDSAKIRRTLIATIGVVRRLVLSDWPPSDSQLRRWSTMAPLRDVMMMVEVLGGEWDNRVHSLRGQVMRLGILDGPPKPLVSGSALMALGIPESVQLGEMLKNFYSAQLDGRLTSTAQALELARAIWHDPDTASM